MISLSWLKNLFRKKKIMDEGNIVQTDEVMESSSGEIEAKVMYQYPKGKFRFPLIPDDDTNENVYKGENNGEIFPEAKKDKAEQLAGKDKLHYRRPARKFHPSDPPSPVFGYERKRKKQEPVVFELDDFLTHKFGNEEGEKELLSEPLLEGEDGPSLMGEAAISSGEEQEYTLVGEKAFYSFEEVEYSDQTVIKVEESEIGLHSAEEILENEKEQPENGENCGQKIGEDETSQVLNGEEITDQNDQAGENECDDEKTGISEGNESLAFDGEEAVPRDEKMPEQNEKPKPQGYKRRSSIPFNVIMLKEDKRKLELKRKQKMERETGAPINDGNPFEKEEKTIIHNYVFPSVQLLKPPAARQIDYEWLEAQKQLLKETFHNFNVRARVTNVTQGPSVARFEVHPAPGVKVSKITNLADDLKLSLAAKDVRIEAPIPGTHLIGIEVPNRKSRPVLIREVIESEAFQKSPSLLTAALGLNIAGRPVITDLSKMPHGLIAGATGSGKSVCINSILVSLLYKANPDDLKLLLIDPKMVELAPYNQIPHLVSPVITDVKAATASLKWAVDEMERRYELFARAGVRDISRYNELAVESGQAGNKLPYIVIVIDELADLMMVSPADVEEAICRIAQKARACGMHLLIATQRPSVDVITGLIKANIPTRIAFSVSSQVDSRTIIDMGGAEKLLGRGDMLLLENGSSKPVRLQGTFVSDEEIDAVVSHVRKEKSPEYLFVQEELLQHAEMIEEDELFYDACEFVVEHGIASTSSLQRKFRIGYNRAARLIDMMEEQGFISEARGSKGRDVFITESDLESLQKQKTIG